MYAMDTNRLEKEQANLRIVLVSAAFAYVLLLLSQGCEIADYKYLLAYGSGYIFFSASLIGLIRLDYLNKSARRGLGIISDVLITTLYMYYLGKYGVFMFAVYLWIIIGNGFRYGAMYLVSGALVAVGFFLLLYFYSPYWAGNTALAVAVIFLLTVVPGYVALLLVRLTREKERAEMANREKSRFIANVSHEIRTPLNAIVGFSNMLNKVDDRQKEQMAERIIEASDGLMLLVDGVLDFSRIESGHVGIRKDPVDLHVLVDAVQGMFSLQVADKGIRYSTRMDTGVPRFIVADGRRLRQVLINLVGNAVKFTETGGIDVHITRAADDRLVIDVTDTGPGIPDELQHRVFDRFNQVDDTATRIHGGTGLGTTIARNLAQLMGGDITLASRPGYGSRFRLTIPLQPADDLSVRMLLQAEAVALNGKSEALCGTVLVVEDCEINRKVYRSMLDYLGIDVVFAESGVVALERLASDVFDMMIVDMQMPGMSGIEVVQHYREMTEPGQRIPVVMITGDATTAIENECRALGIEAFLTKPVGLGRLYALVSRFIVANPAATAGRPVPGSSATAPVADRSLVSGPGTACPGQETAGRPDLAR